MPGVRCPTRLGRWSLIGGVLAFAGGVAAAEEDSLLDIFDEISGPEPAAVLERRDPAIPTTELRTAVNAIANDRGQIRVLVCDDRQAYAVQDYTRAAGYAFADASKGSIEIALTALETGPCAVFVYHDENGDEQLNTNGRMPLEGYAWSGGVDPYLPPGFERAAIVTDTASIRLHYAPRNPMRDPRDRPR